MDPTVLLNAYLKTEYRVDGPPSFSIRVGRNHTDLDAYLLAAGVSSWAFITAENPGSQLLSDEQNRVRTLRFIKSLQISGLRYLPGRGIPDDQNWKTENSFFIPGIARQIAIDLAKEFDQNAIVWGIVDSTAELLWIDQPSFPTLP